MSMSKTTNTYNRQNWETAEFPILCQTCLGENPYVRMTKEKYGKECKICVRPFTVFRWCPGRGMRFKKTEICQTCARLKNACQTCLLDLEYGLPVQVRDAALKVKDELPRSEVNKEYYVQNIASRASESDPTQPAGALGKSVATSDLLAKLARTAPYYKRNRAHICSFWVKGECRRGEECPYRHEKPTDPDDPLASQNIKDRYYGVNDPVADKLMRRVAAMPKLEPPEDRSVTTLYLGNLDDAITEKQLRDHFYQYGEIRQVTLIGKKRCAFVQYTERDAAEVAAERTFNKLILGGRRVAVNWGRSQGRQTLDAVEGDERALEPVPGLPGALPPPAAVSANNFFNLPDMMPYPATIPPPPMPPAFTFPPVAMPPAGIHYPSQDPSRMGTSQGVGKTWPEED